MEDAPHGCPPISRRKKPVGANCSGEHGSGTGLSPQETNVPGKHRNLDSDRAWRGVDRTVRLAAEWYERNRTRLIRECPGGYAVIDGANEQYETGETEEEAERKFRRKYPNISDAAHFRIARE
jgi:hypothetical protein